MSWLLIGLSVPPVVALLYFLLRKQRLTVLQFLFICVLVFGLAVLAIRFAPLFGWLFAGVLPFLVRRLPTLLSLFQFLPWRAGRRRQKDSSQVRTPWFDMRLSHVGGDLDGAILQGDLAGRRLSSLTPEELQALWRQPLDPDSRQLLQTWLDRHADGWREEEETAAQPSSPGQMNREEALAVLGLVGQPGADEIIAAHRRLVQKLHPDRGGSDYLAGKLNEAKAVLLQAGSHV